MSLNKQTFTRISWDVMKVPDFDFKKVYLPVLQNYSESVQNNELH